MPIYEYRCLNCENEFETLVLGAGDPVVCPRCEKDQVERLMSACGFKSSGESAAVKGSSSCASCKGGSCSTCH